jgi:single-stranded-DNA-specific exonuclease
MNNWIIQSRLDLKADKLDIKSLIDLLLSNRGIKTKKETEAYLAPSLKSITAKNLEISEKELGKTIKRLKLAIKNKEKIIIFGDYDVDGIAGAAILWESLDALGADALPYIPHRVDEGYGLSKKGIDNVLSKYPDIKIIVTVDNGIVANEPVEYGNKKGLEIIITDHHAPGNKKPEAYSIVHSTKVCGAAVGFFLANQLGKPKLKFDDHLGLVALATITDVMPLAGFNRTLVKLGLEELKKTKRPGFTELFKLAGIRAEDIRVYELGHVIGPRLNAMGRIEHAMDSLRFICTSNLDRARELANILHITNKERQQLTFDSVEHARNVLKNAKKKKIIIVSDKNYNPGVIGLIAGRLTEQFYRPSIVFSEGEELSKGSARSVNGFNIIEFIRGFSEYLIDKGGHPMAAGLTVKSKDLKKLRKLMEDKAEKEIKDEILTRKIKIDCELSLKYLNFELYEEIFKLSPFGFGNPEPLFQTNDLVVENMKLVGSGGKHLKLVLKRSDLNLASNQGRTLNMGFNGIMFGYDNSLNLKIGDRINVAYNLSLNEWNGNKSVELRIKDVVKINL